ncbi:MAG: winged helix-turn-helix transcriptional regulator, partial [Burkholderiales bacterium]|nr:winged helix-turn-helix transcriptional regulator [Burkholderiales bacterium]
SRPNPAHKRSPLYSLTPMGRALYAQADALWSAQAEQLAALLPSPQLEATTQTLVAILRQLQTNPFSTPLSLEVPS